MHLIDTTEGLLLTI